MPSPVNSSRVIVQNLPKHTKIERFKSYFSKFTTPTDASLSYQKNGTFRNFGFIGFKTAEDAQKAVDYWNNTYFDTSKISVSLAQSAQSSDLPRPWSKHSVGSSANDKATGSNSFKVEEKVKQIPVSENDPKLNEYLNVMMPSSKAKTWANEQQLIELEVKPKNQQVEQADIVVDLAPSIAHDDKVSDMDYFKSKISHSLIEEEESISNSKIQVVDYSTTPKETRKTEPDDIPPAELIIDTGRLLIRNIPFTTTSSEITDIFSKFGPVSETHIPMNPATNTSRGYVFVLFLIPEHAVKAFEQMDGQIFQGRILTILPAREKIEKVIDESLLSFKEKKANDLKKNASTGEISWNSLFMNSDAVVCAMAHKLGVSKSEILDPSAENMAVRLALSETQIINETKEFLESHGVCLDAFSSRKERSNSTILVKNIPFDTKDSDIENLFTRYGSVGRVVIPPSRTIALVEFYQENEAKSAFKLLAFSKFKGLPLYLEWAPMGAFKTKSVKEVVTIDSNEQEDDNAPVATLFIKNLNFSTTTADLQESFSVLQGLKSVRVSQKTDKKGIKLSMGYGFAEFDSRQHAITALAAMQGFILHDHALQLKFSNNTVAKKQETESKKDIVVTGTKLIIRNIPFEASKKDIKQLFSAFGTIKALRIPTKLDNSHRGFGFIEFQTRQESKNAFESLSNTHLYGRHLVLEWAQDDESVDGLREKTRKGFVDEEEREVKKRKVVLGGDQEL